MVRERVAQRRAALSGVVSMVTANPRQRTSSLAMSTIRILHDYSTATNNTKHFSIRACCPAPPSAARRRLICFFHFQNSSLEGWKIMPFKAITQTPVSGRRSNTGMWHAVASWTWDAQDETCGICRMAFDGCCPDCKLPGDDCPLRVCTEPLVTPEALRSIGCVRGPLLPPLPQSLVPRVLVLSSGESGGSEGNIVEDEESSSGAYVGFSTARPFSVLALKGHEERTSVFGFVHHCNTQG
nr:anaphase-promoting complex subunit 11 [Ipomoea batatas]